MPLNSTFFNKGRIWGEFDVFVVFAIGVEAEEVARMRFKFKEIETRLLSVVVFYAKFLFNQDDVINIKKPKVETFLKGMFTRLAKNHHVRNSSFFEMDPLRQDFVIRDIFRQALSNDCLQIVVKQEINVVEEKSSTLQENEHTRTRFSSSKIVLEEEEVYPEDSVSMIDNKNDDKESVVSKVSSVKCKVPIILPPKTVHIDNQEEISQT